MVFGRSIMFTCCCYLKTRFRTPSGAIAEFIYYLKYVFTLIFLQKVALCFRVEARLYKTQARYYRIRVRYYRIQVRCYRIQVRYYRIQVRYYRIQAR